MLSNLVIPAWKLILLLLVGGFGIGCIIGYYIHKYKRRCRKVRILDSIKTSGDKGLEIA